MDKALLIGLPLLLIIGMPIAVVTFLIAVVVPASTACDPTTETNPGAPLAEPGIAGDLGTITGPTGGPVEGRIRIAHANIPNRTTQAGFGSSLRDILASSPDFVTLNEVGGRTLTQIEAAAPGYGAYRDKQPDTTAGGGQAMNNVVLWRRDTWTFANGGRVKIVEDDRGYHHGKRFTWDRFATWALLQHKSDDAVIGVIATHHMTNPAKFPHQHGNPPTSRRQQYGDGMDTLIRLRNSLATHGPVLVGGDMNTHASYTDKNWSAVAKMSAAGYRWHHHGVDYLFYPAYQGVKIHNGHHGAMASDHHYVVATLAMNGAGPSNTTASNRTDVRPASYTGGVGQNTVRDQLLHVRFREDYPTMSVAQVDNLFTLATVADEVATAEQISPERHARMLQVAIITAIQEAKLVNLPGGDRDSAGTMQQRPSQGWGTYKEVTTPRLAFRAFFGRADHTSNTGLLDIADWEAMSLAEAAQAVQRSAYPDAYAQWEGVAAELAGILSGAVLPSRAEEDVCPTEVNTVPVTLGTLNLLGAGHTDGKPGGGSEKRGFPRWQDRLPGAIAALDRHGVSIAALQEVHRPQATALATQYSQRWGMYPASGQQNKVIWDRSQWRTSSARLVSIPYFNGKETPMPLVRLTSISTGQSIWVWSVHNPASTRGNARPDRVEALRRQLATARQLATSGDPVVVMGDFNDRRDDHQASHCVLTPTLTNAHGGSADPCNKPRSDASLDHIYGTNLTWDTATVDRSVQRDKVSDHPLNVATTAASNSCIEAAEGYHLGPVTPQLAHLVNVLGPRFGIETVGGYRESATDPNGHPAGLAADFMVPLTPAGKAKGDALVAYAIAHAKQLRIDYIIWRQRIWSVDRADEGWRPMPDKGSATRNHMDHPHINVLPQPVTATAVEAASGCVVTAPVPARYLNTDRRNWGDTGPHWEHRHTGTDFSAPCGTPVLAAHDGTVEIEHPSWAGTLIKITTGRHQLTTWYAHMPAESLTVNPGQQVAPGQQIAAIGTEGNSTGCHLHFEVFDNGQNIDPTSWLARNTQSISPT